MNVEFSPKSNYQGFHADCAEELQKQCDKKWLTVSIAYAMSQLAYGGATTDEITGARKFVQYLVNLPLKNVDIPQFPKRELNALESHDSHPEVI